MLYPCRQLGVTMYGQYGGEALLAFFGVVEAVWFSLVVNRHFIENLRIGVLEALDGAVVSWPLPYTKSTLLTLAACSRHD